MGVRGMNFRFTMALLLLAGAALVRAVEPPKSIQWGPWYLIGPFPNANGKGFDTAYPPEAKVDLAATYDGVSGAKVKWQRKDEFADGQVNDLLPQVQPNTDVAVYLTRLITCAEARDVPVLLGSDDTLTVWLNGVQLLAVNQLRACELGSDRAVLPLRKGENRLLLKVCQAQQGFGFAFAVGSGNAAGSSELLTESQKIGGVNLPAQRPYLNKKQRYPVGNGVLVAVGDANGGWSRLTGPGYTLESNNGMQGESLIRTESMSLEVDDVSKPMVMDMHRAEKTGIYYGAKTLGDVRVHLVDVAPWGEPVLTRVVQVTNTSADQSHRIRVKAMIAPLLTDNNWSLVGETREVNQGVTVATGGREILVAFSDPAGTSTFRDSNLQLTSEVTGIP